jgi:hypothetical protein
MEIHKKLFILTILYVLTNFFWNSPEARAKEDAIVYSPTPLIILSQQDIEQASQEKPSRISKGAIFVVELTDQKIESTRTTGSKVWSFDTVATPTQKEGVFDHALNPDFVLADSKEKWKSWLNQGTIICMPKRCYFQPTQAGKATLCFNA